MNGVLRDRLQALRGRLRFCGEGSRVAGVSGTTRVKDAVGWFFSPSCDS